MVTRIPPHNIDSERALLGAMMLNAKAKAAIRRDVEAGQFYREAHQALFEALASTEDIVLAVEHLRKKDALEKCGGLDYIYQIAEDISTSVGWEHHLGIVREMAARRKLISICFTAAEAAFKPFSDLEETLSTVKAGVRDLEADHGEDYITSPALTMAVFNDIEKRSQSGDAAMGPLTGFSSIDQHINGLEPKTTTYLIARPSMGKTTLALNIADHISLHSPGSVVYFSLESHALALGRRRLSRQSNVYVSRLRTGQIGSDRQWQDLIQAAGVLQKSSLLIVEKGRYAYVEALVSMVESLAMDRQISAVFIDHIQLMRAKAKFNSRHYEISEISRQIQGLAKDVGAPIVILCQLSRDPEKRGDQRPKLSDMKESGDLEQNADNVWSLYRKDRDSDMALVTALKGRDTGTWETTLRFDRMVQRFSDSDEGWTQEPVEDAEYTFGR